MTNQINSILSVLFLNDKTKSYLTILLKPDSDCSSSFILSSVTTEDTTGKLQQEHNILYQLLQILFFQLQ